MAQNWHKSFAHVRACSGSTWRVSWWQLVCFIIDPNRLRIFLYNMEKTWKSYFNWE